LNQKLGFTHEGLEKMSKAKWTGIGGFIALGAGFICCLGPVILGVLGFGAGAMAIARGFEVVQVPMMILAFSLLGLSFYFSTYKEKGKEGNC